MNDATGGIAMHLCLRCQFEIPVDSELNNEVLVCPHCGWVKSTRGILAEKHITSQFVKFSIGIAILFIVAFIHAVNWGPYFFEAMPLKLKTATGMASSEDYRALSVMCRELQDSDCVENMLVAEVGLSPKDLTALAELGSVQFLRKHYADSVQTYDKYFQFGGDNLDASYTYARALGEVGKVDLAITHYEKILAAKPNVLQVTVTQAYVQMLIRTGRHSDAMAVIKAIRSKGENAAFFMETEMRKLASK